MSETQSRVGRNGQGLRSPRLSESVFEIEGLEWPGTPGEAGGQYTARPGDTTFSVCTRFSVDIEALRDAIADAPPDANDSLLPGFTYTILGVTEEQIMIEEAVHAEFFASGAMRDGIDEDELARACLERSGWSIDLAYRRLEDVADEKNAPVNKWDRIGDKVVAWFLFFFFTGLAVGVLALAQIFGRWIGDAYQGWMWVFVLFFVLLALVLATLAVILVLVRVSEREDARVLRASRWAARRRDFDAAVRNFALDASIEELTRVHFLDPADDVVHVDSSTLTTKAEASQVVRTDTYRQIARQLARADGATLGLRGSRGAGKTDLVRSFCDQSVRQAESDPSATARSSPNGSETSNGTAREDRVIGGFVAAPTSQDETAFLRRVALLVCDRTVEQADERRISTTERDRWWLLAIGAAIIVAGLALAFGLHERIGTNELGWIIVIGGGAFLVVVLARSSRFRRRDTRPKKNPRTASEAWLAEAVQDADALQRKLRQEITTSNAAEGSVGLKAVSGKIARSVTTRDYQMSKDDIIESLSAVIKLLDAAGYRVILGIDELDRLQIDDDTAELLNAMKSLFAIPSCSCIVTISKSAWATFEQRGLRVRTVFDSSLDDIVEARPLSFLDARRLLLRRGAGLSDSQVLFANVAAGGIARDTIRHARVLADLSETSRTDVPLRSAIGMFVEREAGSKVDAAILDIRGADEVGRSQEIIDELKDARQAFSERTFDELVDLLPNATTAGGSRPASERRDPTGFEESVRNRTLLYLAFLRLLEDSFSENGPIAALTTDERCPLVELPAAALEAFGFLTETREELGTGLAAARKHLVQAAAVLRAVEPERSASLRVT